MTATMTTTTHEDLRQALALLDSLAEHTTGGLPAAIAAASRRPSLLEQAARRYDDQVIGQRAAQLTGLRVGTVIRRGGTLVPPPKPSAAQIAAATGECPSGTTHNAIRVGDHLWIWWCGGYWCAEVVSLGLLRGSVSETIYFPAEEGEARLA
jgi:hypothetical protein